MIQKIIFAYNMYNENAQFDVYTIYQYKYMHIYNSNLRLKNTKFMEASCITTISLIMKL